MRAARTVTVLLAVAIAGCTPAAGPATGAASSPEAVGPPVDACVEKGGAPTTRTPAWNTNQDQATWLTLDGSQVFCEFETGEGDGTTRISVDLDTLTSESPTLAAIAYLSPIGTTQPPTVGMNPAEWSCVNDFLGASLFGDTATGGGWVDTAQPVFVVMIPCTFADGSSIDAFGLWYHANGAIRGADLAPLLAYQPGDELPALYDSPRR